MSLDVSACPDILLALLGNDAAELGRFFLPHRTSVLSTVSNS
jgi:hypothetical protein